MDDVAFHRAVFELDRMTPASVGQLLWSLAGERADRSTERVRGWVRAVLGAAERGRNFHERGEAAASFARQLGCPEPTLEAIPCVNEYWDGSGHPGQLAGEEIPAAARVAGVAQSVTIWAEEMPLAEVADRIERHAGGRFDPEVARCAAVGLRREAGSGTAWLTSLVNHATELEAALPVRAVSVPQVAEVFSRIVDSKSPFTASHSERVAMLAAAMSQHAGGPTEAIGLAGLLHDLGKLAVPNTVLDKNGGLDDDEWQKILRHPADSYAVLSLVPGWQALAEVAGSHHERPDGRGYHRGLEAAELPRYGGWLAAADAFDAMVADRPYRAGMTPERGLEELRRGVGTQFTPEAVRLMEAVVATPETLPREHGGEFDKRKAA